MDVIANKKGQRPKWCGTAPVCGPHSSHPHHGGSPHSSRLLETVSGLGKPLTHNWASSKRGLVGMDKKHAINVASVMPYECL